MADTDTDIVGGVDTHKDSHTAAALSETGRLLGIAQFPATPDGYRELSAWLRGFGRLVRVGVEGTGSYGAGLHAYLRRAGVEVREVIRPKRQVRRRHGKSDPVDAEAAARAVIAGEDLGSPKRQDGKIEALRVLRLTRRSALKARTQAANQLHAIIQTAPSPQREQLCCLRLPEMVMRVRRFRCAAPTTPMAAARFALRGLAERWTALDSELHRLDEQLAQLVRTVAAPCSPFEAWESTLLVLSWWRPAITQSVCPRRPPSRPCVALARSTRHLGVSTGIDSIVAATARPIVLCG